MIKPIMKDVLFLQQKSEAADIKDLPIATDLEDTLRANRDRCVGMAANMIGHKKRIIIVSTGYADIVMINPVIVSHSSEKYDAMEGCLSLDGVRPATRYQTIEVDYADMLMKRHRASYSGFTAQAIQHELDHCNGILI